MNPRILVILGCYIFAVLGLNIAVLGPSLQSLATQTGSQIEAFGYMFTAVSAGYLISAPVIGGLGKRLSMRAMLCMPVILIGGMSMIAFSTSFVAVLIGALLIGFGQAVTQVAYTTLLGAHFNGKPNGDSIINRVNAFYGIGALIGPAVVALAYWLSGTASLAFWVAIALTGTILVLGLTVPISTLQAAPTVQSAAKQQRGILTSPILLMMAATMAVYVGVEVAFSGWTTEFTKRATLMDVSRASFASSMFYGGLALSRYFANIFLRRMSPPAFITAMIALATVGLGVMIAPGGVFPVVLLGSGLVGFGLGPVYPTLVALAMQRFPQAARISSSFLISSGSIGAVTLPPIIGGYIASANGLNSAWLFLAAMNVLSIVLWLVAARWMAHAPLIAPTGSAQTPLS